MIATAPAYLTIDEDTFVTEYRPIPNPLDDAAGFDFGGGGCLLETYGADREHLRSADPAKVWTVIDGDNGAIVIESGYHLVNRIGFLVTQMPVPPGVFVTVILD